MPLSVFVKAACRLQRVGIEMQFVFLFEPLAGSGCEKHVHAKVCSDSNGLGDALVHIRGYILLCGLVGFAEECLLVVETMSRLLIEIVRLCPQTQAL